VKRYARFIGLLLLLTLTVYGAYQFLAGDWTANVHYWKGKTWALVAVCLLGVLDTVLEGVGWTWVYERFKIKALDFRAGLAFLSGRAGLLLPAQLNRLIRPDAMVRMGRAPMAQCLKAEAVVFLLDCTSVAALLTGVLAFLVHPLLGPVAALGVIVFCLFLGNRATTLLSGTKMALPPTFWWKWQTLGIVLVEMAGWITHGLAFYLIIYHLNPGIALWEPLFYAPASCVVGSGTGLPGGLGATEGLLGLSMSMMKIPQTHFLLAVGGFRLVTFWIWIPIGWVALLASRQWTRSPREKKTTPKKVSFPTSPVSPGLPGTSEPAFEIEKR
jgi:uncharacterized membrane protein YbhN (UPF0104 family)